MPSTTSQDRHPLPWSHLEEAFTSEFITGYRDGVKWLKTSPPMNEVREIAGLHQLRQQDDAAAEATFYLDADKLRTVVAHCGSYLHVLDGPAHQAQLTREHGEAFNAMNMPHHALSWPGMTPWYQGFELATAQVLDQ